MTRLIDADELYTVLVKMNDFGELSAKKAVRMVSKAPTVDAVPVRHGKWIRDEFGARCGVCGLYAYRDKFDQPWESPYCPMCGARMDKE